MIEDDEDDPRSEIVVGAPPLRKRRGEKKFDVGVGEAVMGSEFEMKWIYDWVGFGKWSFNFQRFFPRLRRGKPEPTARLSGDCEAHSVSLRCSTTGGGQQQGGGEEQLGGGWLLLWGRARLTRWHNFPALY